MQFQIELTQALFIIGGIASFTIEILRALLLNLENYPRLKAVWKYLPSILGVVLILFYPQAVPTVKDILGRMMHGAISPIVFVYLYPQLEKLIETKMGVSPKGDTPDKEKPHDPA